MADYLNAEQYGFCAVSSRVRLARNLADYPFFGPQANRLNGEIVEKVYRTLKPLDTFSVVYMNDLPDLQAGYLREKYFISPLLAENRVNGALIINKDETFSCMVNEEDHLREQCFTEGLNLFKAYEIIAVKDKILSDRMNFARDKDFGYITTCMSNVGTGMRASVMLFLPALHATGKMNEVIAEMKQKGFTVRGVFGEGSRGEGYMYQISNEVTFGFTENEILKTVSYAACKICDLELDERHKIFDFDPLRTEDECMRAYGVLANCKLLDYGEFASLWVKLALGAYYGFYNLKPNLLYRLFINMRPAIISYHEGVFTSRDRDIHRAKLVSETLRGAL